MKCHQMKEFMHMGIPEEREKEIEKIFKEIMANNFPNHMDIQIYEAYKSPSRYNPKGSFPSHSKIKLNENI